MGENEAQHTGRAGRFAGLGCGRMSHGVRSFGCALWTVCIVDEQVRPARVLDYLRARTGIDGEDRNRIRPSDAEAHAFEAMAYQERGDLRLSYLGGLAWDELVPAKTLSQPAFCAGNRQVKVASQRSKRLGGSVDGKRSFRSGCQGG